MFYGILKAAEYVTSLLATGPRVFTGRHGMLTAYDAITLKRVYRFTLLEYKIKALAATSKHVFVEGYARNHLMHSREGILVALVARNGQKRWSYRFQGSCSGISTDGSDVFLVQAAHGKSCAELVALNGATGKRLWSFRLAKYLYGPPVPRGKRIYVLDAQKDAQIGLIALNASTGKMLWVYNPTRE
ncbi:MAG: outer membrane protein assembly factor BamB family protein [Gammaproteobacteria bacterium]